MPRESLNIYLTAVDGMSSVLSSIGDKTKALDKETQQLSQTTKAYEAANESLLKKQAQLQAELKTMSSAVEAARKAYDEYGDEMMKLDMDQAIENQAKLRNELATVNNQLAQNKKAYNEYINDIRKGALQDGNGSVSGKFGGSSMGGDFGSSFGDVLGGLGIGGMMSGLLGNIANQQISSALGTSMGSAVSGALSSAISGAALGTAIAPGIGTALGGLLGGITGAISGGMDMYAEQDDAFIEYYNNLIDTYGGLNAGNTASGSSIASGWEDDLRVFSVLLDDDEAAARRFQDSLIELGRTPPFSYDTVSALSKDMLGLGLSTDEALDRINALAEAAAALDWSESNVSSVISYLESAQLAGVLDSRVVKSLSKNGVNVYSALAEEFNISEDEVMDKLGDLDVDRAVSAIYSYLGERFAGSAEGLANTYSGASGILESYQADIEAAAGEGYNTLRTGGIQEEINSLGGALGDAMREINTIIGKNQARSENLQEEYMREAISAVLLGTNSGLFTEEDQAKLDAMAAEYAEAAEAYENGSAEAGLKMQSLYERAQMMGEALYESSEWAQEEIDVQLEQIEAIRDNTAGLAAAADAFRLAQERSKGLAAAYGSALTADQVVQNAFTQSMVDAGVPWLSAPTFAYGLDRVPYDDYPALLHEGERVLTASEARAMDGGGAAPAWQITVTGNNFMGTGEEMADQIAEILVRKIEQAAVAAAPR